MAGEPIVARTAWSKGGTTYVTIRWNGAVRTRVARPDGNGGWTVSLPGLGDIAVILPATIGTEPTEGRLAARTTMGERLAAAETGSRPGRRIIAPQPDNKSAEPHMVTFSPPPASASSVRRNETEAQLEADLERRRSAARAEWQRLEEERRSLERERQELEEQRRLLAASANSVSAPPPVVSDEDLPAWLRDIPAPDRYVFRHLAGHGSINETEATQMLGGARQFRRFSLQLEAHLGRVPFKVRIEMSGDIKCYVRERGDE